VVRRRVLLAGVAAAVVGGGAFAYPILRDKWDDLDPLLPAAPAGPSGATDGWVVVAYDGLNESFTLNPETGTYRQIPFPHGYADTSPDLRYALLYERDAAQRQVGLALYDTVAGRIRHKLPLTAAVARWSPDGRYLAVLVLDGGDAGQVDFTVTFVNLTTGRTTAVAATMPASGVPERTGVLSTRWLGGRLLVPPTAGDEARPLLLTPGGTATTLPAWPGRSTEGAVLGGDFVVLKDDPADVYDVFTHADPRTGRVLARHTFEQVLPEGKDAAEVAWLGPDRVLFREGTALLVRDVPAVARRQVGTLPSAAGGVAVAAAKGLPPAARAGGAIAFPA